MRAVVVTEGGGLELQTVPDPVAEPGQVLIEVTAAGVNRADLLQRAGHYPPPPGASPFLGLECSGRVVGSGDEVCALLDGGGYAELVAVPAGQVLPLPPGVSTIEAAGLPEAACTVWSNLVMLAHLRRDEVLLVHGGASGIGTMAIQIGKAMGATVLVTVSTAEKASRCTDLGADAAILYPEQDFPEAVAELTDGHGADVILDIVGAGYLRPNLEALATAGRLVVIGLQQGRRGELDLGMLLAKRGALLATGLRGRPATEKAAIVAGVAEYVWPLVADGAIRPVIDRVLPLSQAETAHRVIESSAHVGKVLLRPVDR